MLPRGKSGRLSGRFRPGKEQVSVGAPQAIAARDLLQMVLAWEAVAHWVVQRKRANHQVSVLAIGIKPALLSLLELLFLTQQLGEAEPTCDKPLVILRSIGTTCFSGMPPI